MTSPDDQLQPILTDLLDDIDDDWETLSDGPSLPVILFGAACGVAAGVVALYIGYEFIRLALPVSAALATLMALFVLAAVAAGFTRALGSNAYAANIGLSCGLLILSALFLSVCVLCGAFIAAILAATGG